MNGPFVCVWLYVCVLAVVRFPQHVCTFQRHLYRWQYWSPAAIVTQRSAFFSVEFI